MNEPRPTPSGNLGTGPLQVVLTHLGSAVRGPALGAIVARGAGMAGAFAMSVAILRTLPRAEAGLVLLAYTLLTVAAAASRFGSDNLALREVARHPTQASGVARDALGLTVRLAPLAALLLGAALLFQGTDPTSVGVAVAAAVAVLPAALSIVAGAVLRGLGRTTAGALAELGSPVLIAASGISALGLAGRASAVTAMWAITSAYAVTALWAWGLISTSIELRGAPSSGVTAFLREHGRSLASFFTATLGFFLFTWMPVLALGYVIANRAAAQESVAVFNAGARLAQFVPLISTIQISYLSQRFAAMYHGGDRVAVSRLSQRSTLLALAWATPLSLVMLVVPDTVLSVFGDYATAADTLRILVGAAFVVATLGPVNGLMLTCGHEKAAGRLTLGLLVLSGAGLPLLTRWGSAGVAWGSALVSVAYAVACYVILRRDGLSPAFPGRHQAGR